MSHVDPVAQLARLERELVTSLADYDFHGTPGLHDTACGAVDAYVDAMRASASSPDSVIAAIKRVARSAGYGAPHAAAGRYGHDGDPRLTDFIGRAIARYFRLLPTTHGDAGPENPPDASGGDHGDDHGDDPDPVFAGRHPARRYAAAPWPPARERSDD